MAKVAVRYATAFAPTDIPNMVLHLDATSGVYVDAGTTLATDGQTVQQWNDASGEEHHASQGTAARRPTYLATGFNGRPTLEFVDSVLNTTAFLDASYNTAFTLFFIGQRLNSTGIYINANGYALMAEQFGQSVYFRADNIGTPILNAFGAQATDDITCVGVSYDGTTLRTMVNGHLRTQGHTGNLGVSGALNIGLYSGAVPPTSGYLSAVYAWKSAASDIQMRRMCNYLLAEYGLVAPAPRRIIAYVGDSMTKDMNYVGYPRLIAASMGNENMSHNAEAYPGGGLDYIDSLLPVELDAVYLDSYQILRICSIWAGSNNLAATYLTPAQTATAVLGLLTTCCASRRAVGWHKLIVFTVLPRTYDGQPADWEDRRQAFNVLLRSEWATIADALCDVAADGRIGDIGDNMDETYYLADHIHINDTGHAVVAGLLEPIIAALL